MPFVLHIPVFVLEMPGRVLQMPKIVLQNHENGSSFCRYHIFVLEMPRIIIILLILIISFNIFLRSDIVELCWGNKCFERYAFLFIYILTADQNNDFLLLHICSFHVKISCNTLEQSIFPCLTYCSKIKIQLKEVRSNVAK